MKRVLDWLDDRTGYRELAHEFLLEDVPGGARWRYVWGSTLLGCFFVLVVTGLFLWSAYSPSAHTAWESVYYIQHEMQGGWLLRGLHHFTAQAMVILLALHLMQVVIDGAYKAPREVNFWFGLGLLQLVLALSLTGYLLPWDQKGYWATKVATSIVGQTPFVGPQLQQLLVGGPEYGHQTLTRFFALHAGVLPMLVTFMVAWHLFLFRRHGVHAKVPHKNPDMKFWPDQVLKDAVACLAVLGTVLFIVVRLHGADLGPPADPTENYAAARPEWYFLFLYQFLKLFPGDAAIWGSIIIPGLALLVLALFPIIARWNYGHRFNCGFLAAIGIGAVALTWLAIAEDRDKPAYLAAQRENTRQMERVLALARSPKGLPSTGALSLLRGDPLTQGPRLFAQKCAGCHRYDGHDGLGRVSTEPQRASDLKGFASREWIAGILDPAQIETPRYFGATRFAHPDPGQKKGMMIRFVTGEIADYDDAKKAELQKVVATVSAEARLPRQRARDERDAALIAEGRTLFGDEGFSCADCHGFHDNESGKGPDLTGYGSREWLIKFIKNPAHETNPHFYPKTNDGMPAFEKELDDQTIGLIADWLRGDWYEPAGPE